MASQNQLPAPSDSHNRSVDRSSQEYLEYLDFVAKLWIPSKIGVSFCIDLIDVMLQAGFIIDNVTVGYSGQPNIQWIGTCYDGDCVMYRFVATWEVNPDKFEYSETHFYDLTNLDIEPLVEKQAAVQPQGRKAQTNDKRVVGDEPERHTSSKQRPRTKSKLPVLRR